MIQINLIPDVKLELVKSQRHRMVVMSVSIMVIIASLGLLVLLAGYVFGVQAALIGSATNNIKREDENFRNIEDIEKTVTVSNQLKHIQSSHENKAMTSRIFALLAEASAEGTDNAVAINSFDIDTTQNTISITAQTRYRGFDAAEVFRKNIEGMKLYYVEPEKDAVASELSDSPLTKHDNEQSVQIASEVNLTNMVLAREEREGAGSESVSFRIDFAYDPLLFSQQIDMLRIRGLDRGNVTDSYTRLPQSLFNTIENQEGEQ
ncbi:MAG: hypothetical protein ACTJG2_03660 [Candidatus Saccharimonadales bacterium]